MTYRPSKTLPLVMTLTLQLETQSGGRPTPSQMRRASEALVEATRARLFGEGFLPHDVCIDTHSISVD